MTMRRGGHITIGKFRRYGQLNNFTDYNYDIPKNYDYQPEKRLAVTTDVIMESEYKQLNKKDLFSVYQFAMKQSVNIMKNGLCRESDFDHIDDYFFLKHLMEKKDMLFNLIGIHHISDRDTFDRLRNTNFTLAPSFLHI